MNQNHAFGIEIETNTQASRQQVIDALGVRGVAASMTDRLANGGAAWGIKYDGSIGTGWELVSPVLRGEDGLTATLNVCRALHDLTAAGTRVYASARCGLHVHFSGWGEHDLGKLRNLSRRWCNFEDTFDLMQPESRRASNNTFCRSNARQFGYDPLTRGETMWARTEAATTINDLIDIMSPSRYVKLNLQSLQRHGTVEFRHHSGTVDGNKIVQWTRFLSAFIETSADAQRVWRRRPGPQSERFRKLMRGVPGPTMAYLSSRINRLNGGAFPA